MNTIIKYAIRFIISIFLYPAYHYTAKGLMMFFNAPTEHYWIYFAFSIIYIIVLTSLWDEIK